MTERKRIFVGGLFSSVSEDELKRRFSKFGEIHNVDIKIRKDDDGCPTKTFAYVDGEFTEANLKKCFSVYNKNKWKGSELCLQLAKESFLDKLKREQKQMADTKDVSMEIQTTADVTKPVLKTEVKGAVPGTLIQGEKNWVVGKYGRALPIVYLRRKDKKKIAKMDPSKFCHNVKKIKEADVKDSEVNRLTWELEENHSEITRKRQGNFPDYKPKKKEKKITQSSSIIRNVNTEKKIMSTKQVMNSADEIDSDYDSDVKISEKDQEKGYDSDDELEIVKVKPLPKPLSLGEKMQRIAGMDVSHLFEKTVEPDSDDSAATDEIIASSKNKSSSVSVNKGSPNTYTDSRPSRKKIKLQLKDKSSSKEEPISKATKNIDKNSIKTLQKSDSKVNSSSKESESFNIQSDSSSPEIEQGDNQSDSSSPEMEQGDIQSDSSNNESEKDCSKVSRKRKPPPFKGTKQLQTDAICEPNKSGEGSKNTMSKSKSNMKTKPPVFQGTLKIRNSELSASSTLEKSKSDTEKSVKSNVFKETGEGRKSQKLVDKHTVIYNSSENSDEEMFTVCKSFNFKSSKSKDFHAKSYNSLVMNEFSSGLLPDGVTNVINDTSDTDYDSEDYEKLAKKQPRKNISRDKKSAQDNSVIQDCEKPQGLTPDVSVIKSRSSPSKALQGELVQNLSRVFTSSHTSSNENSEHDIKVNNNKNEKDVSSKFKLQSTSTPLPMKYCQRGDNSSTESSLSLDELSTTFLEEAKNRDSSCSDSDTSEESSSGESSSGESSSGESSSGESSSGESSSGKSDKLQSSKSRSSVTESQGEEKKSVERKTVLKQKDPLSTSAAKLSNTDVITPKNKPPPNTSVISEKGTKIVKNKQDPTIKSVDKHLSDNQKRLESLRQRQKETLSQKSLVQAALKSVDTAPTSNKKIMFSSDDELVDKEHETSGEQQDYEKKEKVKSGKVQLFDSSDSESESEESSTNENHSDADMFEIKPQFQGAAGKKLMDLQSRFGNDPRFKLDERFMDTEKQEDVDPQAEEKEESEKVQMLKILRDVVGSKVSVEDEGDKKKFKGAIHFDPSKEDHKQFEVKTEGKKKVKITDFSDEGFLIKEKTAEQLAREIIPEVSTERYFEVSSSLADTFRRTEEVAPSSGGFSLLAAFGRPEEDLEMDTTQAEEEIPLRKASSVFPWQHDLVKDSSDEAEDDVMSADEENKEESLDKASTDKEAPRNEKFFYAADDPRFKDGVQFFCRPPDYDKVREKWQEDRPRLIEAYRCIHKRVSRRLRIAQSKKEKRPKSQSFHN